MTEYKTIEIDFDIHKLIEAERQGFSDTANSALRRLVGLGAGAAKPQVAKGKPWTSYGVELPHGTQLRMTYNGKTHRGDINNGSWVVEGGIYTSPSGAASGVARTRKGTKTRLDGWEYWYIKLPESENWVPLYALWETAEMLKKSA